MIVSSDCAVIGKNYCQSIFTYYIFVFLAVPKILHLSLRHCPKIIHGSIFGSVVFGEGLEIYERQYKALKKRQL